MSPVSAGYSDVFAQDDRLVRLVGAYRDALRVWVRRRVYAYAPNEDHDLWTHLLDAAGPPAQSWFLAECWRATPDSLPRPCCEAKKRLAEEIASLSAGSSACWSEDPVWAETYFAEERGLRSANTPITVWPSCSRMDGYVAAGWNLLQSVWPEAARLVALAVTHHVAYQGTKQGYTGSTPKAFGAVFVAERAREPSALEYATTLVHETAHLSLHAVRCTGRLLFTDEGRLIYSPFRRESRTALGVIHSAYALARMIQFLDHAAERLGRQVGREVLISRSQYAAILHQTLSALNGEQWTALGDSFRNYVTTVADRARA